MILLFIKTRLKRLKRGLRKDSELQITTINKNLDIFFSFFRAVFDQKGIVLIRVSTFQILEDKDFKGKAIS